MLTMVPSMMTSEMAIDIKTRPTQRFLTFDIQNSQTQLLGENLWVLQLPKALWRLYSPRQYEPTLRTGGGERLIRTTSLLPV